MCVYIYIYTHHEQHCEICRRQRQSTMFTRVHRPLHEFWSLCHIDAQDRVHFPVDIPLNHFLVIIFVQEETHILRSAHGAAHTSLLLSLRLTRLADTVAYGSLSISLFLISCLCMFAASLSYPVSLSPCLSVSARYVSSVPSASPLSLGPTAQLLETKKLFPPNESKGRGGQNADKLVMDFEVSCPISSSSCMLLL